MTTIRERFTQTNNPNIPSLASGASQLLTTVMDDDINIKELVNLLEQYPVITTRLISVANSAWSSPRGEILDLESACIRLGLEVVRSATIALTVQSPFKPINSHHFKAEHFWSSGLIMANVVQKISPIFQINPQLARTVGLIRHLGLLWLVDEASIDVDTALSCAENEPETSLNQQLISICGIGYVEATAHLFYAWELPQTLISAVSVSEDLDSPFTQMLDTAWVCTQALYNTIDVDSLILPNSSGDASEYLHGIYEQLATQTEKTKELARTLFP